MFLYEYLHMYDLASFVERSQICDLVDLPAFDLVFVILGLHVCIPRDLFRLTSPLSVPTLITAQPMVVKPSLPRRQMLGQSRETV